MQDGDTKGGIHGSGDATEGLGGEKLAADHVDERGGADDDLLDRLLLGTLPHVPFDGWTLRAMQAGAADAGLSPGELMVAAPGGVRDLIEHFSSWADVRMLEAMAETDLAPLRTRDKVALGVRSRLEALAPHKEAVRRATTWLALPVNAPLGVQLVARTCDAVWNAAGDTSTDFNWYTKRGLLAGVLGTTTLYWLNDGSDGHADTWSFLDRRIGDVLNVGRFVARPGFNRLVEMMPSPARFARQLRRRMQDS